MKPESLILGMGPPASGTTWLYQLLYAHSQVSTTTNKEVNFFNDHFDQGFEWYRQQFRKPTRHVRLFADISPTYLLFSDVSARIRQFSRNPRLIVTLRSPYQRTLSWYQRFRRDYYDITEIVSDSGLHTNFVKLGCIADKLRSVINQFGSERVFFLWNEDLVWNQEEVSAQLQRWLNLAHEKPVSVNRRVMASVEYRYPWSRQLLRGAGKMTRRLSPSLFHLAKFGPLHDVVFRALALDEKSAAKAGRVFDGLRDHFERDIDELEILLNRDLSSWRIEQQKRQLFLAHGVQFLL